MQATPPRHSRLFRWLAGLLLLAALFPVALARADAPSLTVPYVPTPQPVVERILAMAGVTQQVQFINADLFRIGMAKPTVVHQPLPTWGDRP